MTIIQRLESGQGYAFDYKAAREDRLARFAAEYAFGPKKVEAVLNTLHRSTMDFDLLMEDFFQYEHVHAKSGTRSDPVYKMAFNSVLYEFRNTEKVPPIDINNVPDLTDFPNSKSPGLPYKNMGFNTKRAVIDAGYLPKISQKWGKIASGYPQPLPDVCLFARAQVARVDKNKIRATWGYPIEVYLQEGSFFYPLQDIMKDHTKHSLHIAYGYEMACGGMVALNDMLTRTTDCKYMCTDWSRFDKTIPPWLIRDAFAILASLIDFDHVIKDGVKIKVNATRQRRRWKTIIDYFIETPVRNSKGERFLVKAGVPSGSCFTNIIDSIINVLVTRYICFHTTGYFPVGEIFLGDDGVYAVRGCINLEDMANLAREKFGMILNVSKSYVTSRKENVHFLGYFNKAGVPFKNQDFLIASFVRPERTRRHAEEAAAAALGQLYSSFDPIYSERWVRVIKFCCSAFDLGYEAVALNLRNNFYRHKYLAQVGFEPAKITIPVANDIGVVYESLPPTSCKYRLPLKSWSEHVLQALVYDTGD